MVCCACVCVCVLREWVVLLMRRHPAAPRLLFLSWRQAPEVWRGLRYAYSSDLWSLGGVLYEMMTYRCAARHGVVGRAGACSSAGRLRSLHAASCLMHTRPPPTATTPPGCRLTAARCLSSSTRSSWAALRRSCRARPTAAPSSRSCTPCSARTPIAGPPARQSSTAPRQRPGCTPSPTRCGCRCRRWTTVRHARAPGR